MANKLVFEDLILNFSESNIDDERKSTISTYSSQKIEDLTKEKLNITSLVYDAETQTLNIVTEEPIVEGD